MRKYFLWIVLLIALVAWGLVLLNRSRPCEKPIQYAVGTYDSRFNISKTDLLDVINSASLVWEKAIDKNLFAYDTDGNTRGDVMVNLVYDERQRLADRNEVLKGKVDVTKKSADAIKSQFNALKSTYAEKQAAYLSLLQELKTEQASYNNEVDALNSRGGASKEEYAASLQRKKDLQAFQARVEAERLEVNRLADEVNALVKQYNFLVVAANKNIGTINQTAGQEFEEGLYIYDDKGQRINIYEFGSRSILLRVLTHELGHALGMDHNDNPSSIMFYLNSSANIKPTAEDVAGLKAICGIK